MCEAVQGRHGHTDVQAAGVSASQSFVLTTIVTSVALFVSPGESDMDLNPVPDPRPANVQATRRTTPTQPRTASMFNNAQNIVIMGGSFNNTINTTNINTVDGLAVLHKRVAPNAILNAGGRADEVRCHPGTREEVIGRIEKWRDAEDELEPPIFWLSGPAGAGKTAIAQTIAERCKAQGVPQANFFFFRADGSRNNATPLVATLLHQFILLYPALRDSVAGVFSDNPLILDSILDEQLAQLLLTPLRAMQQSDASFRPPLLLIDGLDECDTENKNTQRQILRAFDKILAKNPCPFRLLVASRDESQIRTAFNEISSPVLPLYLNNEYAPERDIRVFVVDQFKHIRRTHPLACTLEAAWPSFRDIKGIVEKSSGQFIYAATVMRFISDSSASPVLSLQRVQGAAQIATKSPFSYLDAIYTYILSQVDDQESLKDILHAQLLIDDDNMLTNPASLLQFYNPKYTDALVRSCVADITSIARYYEQTLLFHHASFSDYLLDKSRPGQYFVDIDAFNVKILPALWKCVGTDREAEELAYAGVGKLRILPPDLLNTISTLDPSNLISAFGTLATPMFEQIYNLCTCDDDVISYKRIIRRWVNVLDDSDILDGSHGAERPPCSRRYFIMAQIERNPAMELDDETATALRPETDFDTRETGLWLDNLLHRIHGEYYSDKIGNYYGLLEQWASWAAQNDIPLDGLDDLPGAQWYLRKGSLEKWVARHLKIGSGKK